MNEKDSNDKRDKSKISRDIAFCILGILLGGLFSFWLDKMSNVNPKIDKMLLQIDSLSCAVKKLDKEAHIVTEHITYKPFDGEDCKVGYNPNLEDNIASVTPDNPHGLREGDRISITYKKGFSIKTQIVMVQINSQGKENSDADIFLNIKTFKELGIEGKERFRGVFPMSFKKIRDK